MWVMSLCRVPLKILISFQFFFIEPHEPLVGSEWYVCMYVCMYVCTYGLSADGMIVVMALKLLDGLNKRRF